MLWDIIRDWFVMYIFGGFDSLGNEFMPMGGFLLTYENGEQTDGWTAGLNEIRFQIGQDGNISQFIGVADWLSTTATIITLVLLVVMLLAMVRFIIRQVSGLFAKI